MDSDRDHPDGWGCPIRRSSDQRPFAAPRSFSQRTTSFIASWHQGIHQTPLRRLISFSSSPQTPRQRPQTTSRAGANPRTKRFLPASNPSRDHWTSRLAPSSRCPCLRRQMSGIRYQKRSLIPGINLIPDTCLLKQEGPLPVKERPFHCHGPGLLRGPVVRSVGVPARSCDDPGPGNRPNMTMRHWITSFQKFVAPQI